MDSLVANSNERVNQKHKNKKERGKTSAIRDRKEMLIKFNQASSDL